MKATITTTYKKMPVSGKVVFVVNVMRGEQVIDSETFPLRKCDPEGSYKGGHRTDAFHWIVRNRFLYN